MIRHFQQLFFRGFRILKKVGALSQTIQFFLTRQDGSADKNGIQHIWISSELTSLSPLLRTFRKHNSAKVTLKEKQRKLQNCFQINQNHREIIMFPSLSESKHRH